MWFEEKFEGLCNKCIVFDVCKMDVDKFLRKIVKYIVWVLVVL